jgi:hypothetical protein
VHAQPGRQPLPAEHRRVLPAHPLLAVAEPVRRLGQERLALCVWRYERRAGGLQPGHRLQPRQWRDPVHVHPCLDAVAHRGPERQRPGGLVHPVVESALPQLHPLRRQWRLAASVQGGLHLVRRRRLPATRGRSARQCLRWLFRDPDPAALAHRRAPPGRGQHHPLVRVRIRVPGGERSRSAGAAVVSERGDPPRLERPGPAPRRRSAGFDRFPLQREFPRLPQRRLRQPGSESTTAN